MSSQVESLTLADLAPRDLAKARASAVHPEIGHQARLLATKSQSTMVPERVTTLADIIHALIRVPAAALVPISLSFHQSL